MYNKEIIKFFIKDSTTWFVTDDGQIARIWFENGCFWLIFIITSGKILVQTQ